MVGNKLLIWNGCLATVCEINTSNTANMVSDLYSVKIEDAKFVALHMDSILKIEEYRLCLVNQEGVVKYELSFPKSEGAICGYHKNSKTLAVYTTKCFVRLIDLSKREIKTIGNAKHVDELLQLEHASIADLKLSYDSSRVLMIMDYLKSKKEDKNLIVIWNIEGDTLCKQELEEEPTSLAWEESDSRLFAALCMRPQESGPQVKEIKTFFYNAEKNRIKVHDTLVDASAEALFVVQSPSIVTIALNNNLRQDKINYILRDVPMKEFEGVSTGDKAAVASVINFNFHLSNGNMEEAYKSIKHLNATEIWRNMAEMSVKMKRVDVAETCFSNMKFARGSKALRESAAKAVDKDTQISHVAVLLNLVDDAEKILRDAKK